MTNDEIRKIAMEQSAIDMNCKTSDFLGQNNKTVISKLMDGRKRYITDPHFCSFVCYGNALVASVDKRINDFIISFSENRIGFRCFEQVNLLTTEFNKYGKQIGIEEFYLPDINKSRIVEPTFEIKLLFGDEISSLYSDSRFRMALSYCSADAVKRDVIAVVGYKNNQIIGVAGASNDSDTMWQVGIDVVPEHRNCGAATVLVKIITDEILKKGIVPFYGTAWSNIASKNVAVSSGYKPAWVELHAYDIE